MFASLRAKFPHNSKKHFFSFTAILQHGTWIYALNVLARANRRHFVTPTLFSPKMTSEERAQKCYTEDVSLPKSGVVLLIGGAAWEICYNQSEALPRSASQN